MTQYGPTSFEAAMGAEAPAPPRAFGPLGAEYIVCRLCTKRFKLGALSAPSVLEAPDAEPRCECGARLHPYAVPAELDAPARGVLPRLIKFWRAGREDGYWDEKRFFRPAAAERAGVSPRQVRFAYESGRRAGERLRAGAHLHALRVMKMKAAGATPLRAA